ncbi:hypothetical protein Q1695_014886 [Nippostrongylus brasiliensis]|nr:hypothetical protein Q1695_014886 [Nippostrongylus brasiliensis]
MSAQIAVLRSAYKRKQLDSISTCSFLVRVRRNRVENGRPSVDGEIPPTQRPFAMRSNGDFLTLFALLLLSLSATEALGGHGLVNPQSSCNIRCENGGMCAFSFDNPHHHSCICLMGVYEGERCEREVGSPRMNLQQPQQQAPPPPPPAPAVNYNAQQVEMERQREIQRRREYERRLEEERRRNMEEDRRRKEESRRVGLMPVAASKPVEDQRIEELRRRDEELRRIAARRREEERRREQQQQQARDEEQRRLQFSRQEENRIQEERRREEEHRRMSTERMETTTGRMGAEEMTTAPQRKEQTEDVVAPEGADWEYKSEEEEDNDVDAVASDDYLPNDSELEKSGDLENAEPSKGHESAGHSDGGDEGGVLSGIAKAIESAAEMTVKVHTLELDTESASAPSDHEDDDYWDHSIKREDEDYETPKAADMSDDPRLSPAEPSNPSGVREFTAEEGEEGWMMMKRVDENSSTSMAPLLTLSVLMLIYSIW